MGGMLPIDFYLASLRFFKPEFGFSSLLRLRQCLSLNQEQVDLEEIGRKLELPPNWRKTAFEWWTRQSEESQVIWCFSKDYPEALLQIENPPLFLFVKGEWQTQRQSKRISMVGSRDVSSDVLTWMDIEVSNFLKSTPVTLISGGARGVDQKAHFLALRNFRPTWVFLPSGLNRLYPASWKEWQNEFLTSGGVFISEYPLGTEMRKHHFVRRNELIVAVSEACFVLQAARRSGSYLTAQIAQKAGVPLAALSHFPADLKGLGCLDLLADGATLIRDAADLKTWVSSLPCG